MTSIVKPILDWYHHVNVELADPRTNSYPLISSPFPLLIIIGSYLYFILKWGPEYMKNRAPFRLKYLLMVYNVIQIVTCLYFVIQTLRYTIFSYNFMCEPVDYSYDEIPLFIAKNVWYFLLLKILDLLDTIFFVLRKKSIQVTFLHVYHHVGMCILGWMATKYLAGGHGTFVGFLNSAIHVVMYFYYLVSALDKDHKKHLWWKKHVTHIQIIQFMMFTVYFLQTLFQPSCGYPKWAVLAFIPNNVLIMLLFMRFYYKSYVQSETKPKLKAQNGYSNGVSKNHTKKN